MSLITAIRRRSVAALAATVVAAASGLVLLTPTAANAAEMTRPTTVSVTSASVEGGLVVAVSGTEYIDLPNASTGSPAAGVYAAVVDEETANDEITTSSALAQAYVPRITAGSWTTSLTVPTTALSRDGHYDVVVWVAHGFVTDTTLLYRGAIELSDEQRDALFPPPAPVRTTSVSVTSASVEGGLVVGVSGSGYTNLPKASTGKDAAGVYAAIVGHDATDDYIGANASNLPAVAFVWNGAISDGAWSSALKAPVDKLARDVDYDVIVWVAHGNPTEDTVLYRAPLALTVGQHDALFPAPVWSPAIQVSKVDGLDPDGETITVSGSGFDPTVLGTRSPLKDLPAGVYVVVGAFSPNWRPSTGALSSARKVIDQKWAIPGDPSSLPNGLGTNPQYVPLSADGTFTATLTASTVADGPVDGVYGVYTYPASGATNAAQELAVPITFSSTEPTTTSTEPTSTSSEPTTTTTSSPSVTTTTTSTTGSGKPTTSTAPTSTSKAIVDGSLLWGVKQSFRDYVLGTIAHGAITPAGGATLSDGIVTFPKATGQLDGTQLSVAVSGSVRFTGHEMGGVPMLDLTLSNLAVAVSGTTGTLTADVHSKSLSSGTFTDLTGVKLAALDLSGHPMTITTTGVTLTGVPATLTAAGAAAFEGFYQAGDDLDPVSLVASVAGGTGTTSTGSTGGSTSTSGTSSTTATTGSPSSTVASVSAGSVTAGGQLDVGAGGFVPGETVQVWLHSDPILLTTTTAAADGTAAVRVTVPSSVEAGAHTIVLKGLESGRSASVGITVVATTVTTTGPAKILGGSLSWGVLASFRSYIGGSIAHGSWSVSGGAVDNTGSGGGFSFPLVSGSADAGTVSASFAGSVRFIGHDMGSGPLLDLTIANPRISASGTTGTLYVDVRSRSMEDPSSWYQVSGVALATLDLSGQDVDASDGRIDWSGVPVTLSGAGASAFAGFYQAGQAMDPLALALRVGAAGSAGSGSGGLASTGVTPVAPMVALALGLIALGLMVLGAGSTLAGRRRRALH